MSGALPVYNASTGTMCFAAALLSLKAGGLVRRRSWPPLTWVGLETVAPGFAPSRLFFRLPNGAHESWVRPMPDLLAEDWEEALVPYGVKP
jgi:hypothetical protein